MSRVAFDLLLDERDRLRARNDHLEDSMVRIQRVRHGMKETAREPRKVQSEAIPDTIRALYQGFQSESAKKEYDSQVREMRAAGAPWDQIERVMLQQFGDEAEA